MAEKKSTVIHVLTIASLLLMLIVYILAWKHGLFTDQNALKSFLDQSGIWAGVIFIFLQILQVIFPIIPGGLGCLAGVLLFGAWHGFLYNYIGICLGSFFAFLIARTYGAGLLKKMFSTRLLEKYGKWTRDQHTFDKMFALAIFLPMAPDDFLCYLAGTTEMKLSVFCLILMLGKPASIALYSLGLEYAFHNLLSLLGGVR